MFGRNLVEDWQSMSEATFLHDLKLPRWILNADHLAWYPSANLLFHVSFWFILSEGGVRFMTPPQVFCLGLTIWNDLLGSLGAPSTFLRWSERRTIPLFCLLAQFYHHVACHIWDLNNQRTGGVHLELHSMSLFLVETTNEKCLPTSSCSEKEGSWNT